MGRRDFWEDVKVRRLLRKCRFDIPPAKHDDLVVFCNVIPVPNVDSNGTPQSNTTPHFPLVSVSFSFQLHYYLWLYFLLPTNSLATLENSD